MVQAPHTWSTSLISRSQSVGRSFNSQSWKLHLEWRHSLQQFSLIFNASKAFQANFCNPLLNPHYCASKLVHVSVPKTLSGFYGGNRLWKACSLSPFEAVVKDILPKTWNHEWSFSSALREERLLNVTMSSEKLGLAVWLYALPRRKLRVQKLHRVLTIKTPLAF